MTPGHLLDEVPGLVDQLLVLAVKAHVHKDIARVELSHLRRLLAGLHLRDGLGGKQDLEYLVVQFLGRLELLDVQLYLVLLAGEGVKREPLGAGRS